MELNNESKQTTGPAQRSKYLWERDSIFFGVIFLLLTLAACWPILWHPTRHLSVIPIADKGTNLWNLWWVYYALFERGISPLRCDMIFIPWGCDLRFHTLSLANGVLAAPATGLFGPVVAFNLLFMAWTALTGCFASLWARQWGAGRPMAVLLGVIAAFGPYRWGHMIHLNLFSTPWLFLALYFCERSRNSRRFMDGAGIAFAWLMAFFSDWYYGLFVGLYLAVRCGSVVWRNRFWDAIRWIAGYAILPACAVGVALWMYFSGSSSEGYVDPVSITFSSYWSLDVLHLLLPLWLLPKIGHVVRNEEFWLHPGLVLMASPLIFWRCLGKTNEWRSKRTILFIIAITFLILSFGPLLMCNAVPVRVLTLPVFLPAGIFELIPGLTIIRVYARFAYVGILAYLLLGLLGMQNWMDARGFRRGNWAACIILSGIFLLETGWRFPPMIEYRAPDLIYPSSPKPVLELPFTPSSLNGMQLYHQTLHHQSIFVTEFSRLGHYKEKYLTAYPALTALNRLALGDNRKNRDSFNPDEFSRDFQQLGPLHMVLFSNGIKTEEIERMRQDFQRVLNRCRNQNIEYCFSE